MIQVYSSNMLTQHASTPINRLKLFFLVTPRAHRGQLSYEVAVFLIQRHKRAIDLILVMINLVQLGFACGRGAPLLQYNRCKINWMLCIKQVICLVWLHRRIPDLALIRQWLQMMHIVALFGHLLVIIIRQLRILHRHIV